MSALPITFSAVLLAGGQSRRMGTDKAALVFRGQALWQRQIQLLRDLRREKIFVSARRAPSWLPDDVELLLDEPPSRGPLSGLTKALAVMRTTHLVVLAVDMPFVTIEEIRGLMRLAGPGRGVVPVIGERAEPLAAVYPAEVAEKFQAALTGPDFSLQRIVRRLGETDRVQLLRVPEASEELYRSLNEPADFNA
jgi:molybdopterin-guanine dinucleotide biosynthesis protein A